MAYVNEVVKGDDSAFTSDLPEVLSVIDGRLDDLQLSATIALEASAVLVLRYAHCEEKPEHDELRDVCLRRIGNPWLERPAWDASVKSEPARRMVEGWLKRRLIKDFFELLAHDGAAEVRRLNYWLKWEPKIEDMWFVLGVDARLNRTAAFVSVLERMEGRARHLIGATPDANNAFIMRIGSHFLVEFGLTNNACFVFPVSGTQLRFEAKSFDIFALKHQPGRRQLNHSGRWEFTFNGALGSLLGKSAPTALPAAIGNLQRGKHVELARLDPVAASLNSNSPNTAPPATDGHDRPSWPAFTPSASTLVPTPPPAHFVPEQSQASYLDQFQWWAHREVLGAQLPEKLVLQCLRMNLTIEDNRSKGGALWLRLPRSGPLPGMIWIGRLETYGFKFAKGKGFYYDEPD